MSEYYGEGVSRVLSALQRQFRTVVWQKGHPPLDSELNLMSQIELEELRQVIQTQCHSGFLLDPTLAMEDFVTHPLASNMFFLGQQRRLSNGTPEELAPVLFAVVNGWVIPITGTRTPELGGTYNTVKLFPPPATNARIDFVFLEVWTALVAPNPSLVNKPAKEKIWAQGNVEFGQDNPPDDLLDPTIAYQTTKRVQLQYRIRIVGSGTGAGVSPALDQYPDGLGDPNILAQGPRTTPSTYTYTNMRTTLGDPSLWRAGNGDPQNMLGTTDGYTYAIPIAGIFRRNSSPFVAAALAGSPNQNGAWNRTPSSQLLPNPQDGAKMLTQMSLINDLPSAQFVVDTLVEVDGLIGSGFDDTAHNLAGTFLVINGEVIGISAINTGASPNTITIPAGGRGRWGSDIVNHTGRSDPATPGTGTFIHFFNTRPDGLFADSVALQDFVDLRRGVNFGDWDYGRILLHNVSALMHNRLRSTWKQCGAPGGDTQGVTVEEVDYLLQDGGTAVPFGTEALDGPDGIRQVWSDAATIQGDVTLLLDPAATMNAGFIQVLDDSVEWDVGADFKPTAFMNNLNNTTPGYTDGTTIFLNIGGDDGSQGARKTFRDGGTRAVRFVSPLEFWKQNTASTTTGMQHPVTMLWVSSEAANTGALGGGAGLQALTPAGPGESPTRHPGPMYPLQFLGFEKPYLVLGGVLNRVLEVTGIQAATQLIGNALDPTISLGEGDIVLPGLNFDTVGDWYSLDTLGDFQNDASLVNYPVLRGQRTLFDMLTAGGTDRTGTSSEVYLILFGDDETRENNGAFKVLGAGTVGYTTKTAGASNRLRVQFLTQGATDFNNTSTKTVTAQVRSQITNAEDGDGAAVGPASMTITLTDVTAQTGGGANPWHNTNINPGGLPGYTLTTPYNYKLVLNCTLLYHPGRGGTARVADRFNRVAMQSPPSKILRQSKSVLDPAFPALTGAPGNPAEANFDYAHVQTWNRLPSLGLPAPQAPAYGGNVVLFSEVTRETEVFLDAGSKTLLIRPHQRQAMTIQGVTTDNTFVPGKTSLLGDPGYPNPALIANGWDGPKDDAQLLTLGLQMGYAIPSQYVPRFGRQDIPYYQDNGPAYGSGTFLEGINHLFLDTTDLTDPVFDIIGGDDNQSGGQQVTRFLLQTGATSGLKYGQYGTVTGTLSQAYQGRLTSEIGTGTPNAAIVTARLRQIASSDFGPGLSGIQLPPYVGIARLYGVYDRRDFVAKGALTYSPDRVTPEANRAINLMRRDATKQTLYILQDGALDLTREVDDHTYIIPQNVLDLTKSPFYAAGETFDDLEYVVEFTVFNFAQGFINKNNFAVARRHNGQGTLRTDGDNPELIGTLMCIPSAAPDSSRIYAAYERTVYQGDPYMTRNGDTRVTSDYEDRYGQVPPSDAFELLTSIQQFDAAGAQIPQKPNARSFEILAAVDVYTTLGSGKVGGRLYPGTITDVGHTETTAQAATRMPATLDDPAFRVVTRTFTEGQRGNTSRASAQLEVIGNNATFDFGVTKLTIKGNGLSAAFTAVNGPTVLEDEFDASSPDPAVIAREIWTKINARGDLQNVVVAFNDIDATKILLMAWDVGSVGNDIVVEINDVVNLSLLVPLTGQQGLSAKLTTIHLNGGQDLVLNAGAGTTQLGLTGLTERLPMGILLQDSDFLGENPLNDESSALQTVMGGIRPSQALLPLTRDAGEEYTRFSGAPGEIVAAADGAILQYGAFTDSNPGGSKRFRLFRGGGSTFVLQTPNPGGPIDWVSDSIEPAVLPVLKGGLLAIKALLIRNFPEVAFADQSVVSEGDEVQMVVLTNAIMGTPTTQAEGITLSGIISPTGYGEGTAAADRYRLTGKPMFVGPTRYTLNALTQLLAFFPGRDAE